MNAARKKPKLEYELDALYLIEWRDIASHKGGEWSDDPKSGGTWPMLTAGWVTDEDDMDVTIHSTIGDPSRPRTYGHDTAIPKGCVIKKTMLRKPRRKDGRK